ncbi:hypothetical protein NDI37_03975 [Funiculus sociatus GB2-A5]|jgi:hypothetical protein|uniref:Uncharacterized protein n=1 Tax=Funiculus sociatus GB2-A5 TaxID=2933946 RepID=A0ABV0JJM2_9CYAN|nr:hypothetical protein [Trichocoleus sp. FACHB-6]MBD2061700.1 hypothetical protein [Trichocoleus sp. FACHB-6]
MHSQSGATQLTFHYIDGNTESFTIYEPAEAIESQQEMRQEVRRLLDKSWWILHLAEETVFINTANIIKVEVKPSMPHLHGEDVFANAERVTALTRGNRK